MRLTADEFSACVESLYEDLGEKLTWAKVVRDSGLKSSTISMQRTRNEVDAQILVNISRKYGLNPLRQLARVPRWAHIVASRSAPSTLEIVASLHPAYIFREISDRLLNKSPCYADFGPWDNYYGRFSTWVDVVGPENVRDDLRRALSLLTPSSLSSKLNSRSRFEVDEMIDGFTAVEMDPVYALVLASTVTAQEAGYSDTIRADALSAVPDEILLSIAQRQMRYTSRILAENRPSADRLSKTSQSS